MEKTSTETTIGTTFGLATREYSGKGCEQVYVKETGDEKRPIRLEFHEGYSVPNHAMLTRNQAIELAFIILRWAGAPASVLTKMLRIDLNMEPGCDFEALADEDTLNAIKSTFRKWLAEVGLPDYFSLDKVGNGFNSTESIRKLLITLVDEPSK